MWVAFAREYDKELRLAEKYPKGHGAWFYAWLKWNYPVILMFHVKSTYVTRQGIIYSSSLAMHLNYLTNIKFLENIIGVPGKQHNILQRNLYVLLMSDDMVAQS